MLIYNQAYDLFHTIFRSIQIKERIASILEVEKYRILDFYLTFPAELLEIKSFRGFAKYESLVKSQRNRYEYVFDRRRVFLKMEQIQLSALRSVVSYGLFDATEFKNGGILRTERPLPDAIASRVAYTDATEARLLELITGPIAAFNLYGHLGLKVRSNLLEFKYDAI